MVKVAVWVPDELRDALADVLRAFRDEEEGRNVWWFDMDYQEDE